MRFWFDTEFYEDGKNIDLISIGVVAEDGRTYYAETPYANMIAGRTGWLRQNVAPYLCGPHVDRWRIASDLIRFMGEEPEIWAYYADYDWVALCQLHGRMIDLPKGWPMFCRDVKQLAVDKGNPELPKQESSEHNALADALWTRKAWQFLSEIVNAKLGAISMVTKINRYDHGGARVWLEDDEGRRDLVADLYSDGSTPANRREEIIAALITAGIIPPETAMTS